MSICPRDPGVDGSVDSLGQKIVETEWEGDGELDGREAHKAEVAIGIEARAIRVEELLDHNSAFEKGAKGEHSVDDGDEGEEGRPHPEKWECNCDIVRVACTTDALDDVAAVTLNDDV